MPESNCNEDYSRKKMAKIPQVLSNAIFAAEGLGQASFAHASNIVPPMMQRAPQTIAAFICDSK